MYKNYFKIALRNLARNKFFSTINIIGLSIGIAGCLLIGLFVWDELQYDRFHKDADRIFRIYDKSTNSQGVSNVAPTSPMFETTLNNEFPEAEQSLRILNIYGENFFRSGDKKGYEERGIIAEENFFDFFTLPLIEGNPKQALSSPYGVVITQEVKKKYLGDGEALGKTIFVGSDNMKVTGVLAKLPEHFHMEFSYIIPMLNVKKELNEKQMQSWNWQQFFTYVKLKPNTNKDAFEKKFQKLITARANPVTKEGGFTYIPFLQRVTDIHLHSSDFKFDIIKAGNITYVKALSIIAIFVLLIACFNFINLSTARSLRRAKEVGVRKVVGAEQRQIWAQFTGESIFISLLATVLASIIAYYFLPSLNHFTEKHIVFNPLTSVALFVFLVGLGIVVGIFAGIYPAIFISRFNPIYILKGMKSRAGKGGNNQILRKALVVIQFALSVFLISCAAIVFKQVDYMHHKDLGFNKEQLMFFPMRGENMKNNYETFKNEIISSSGVVSATIAYGYPGDIVSGDDIIVPGNGKGTTYPARQFMIDYDYLKTMGLHIIAGRDFSKSFATDSTSAFIINETAVKELGLGTPETAIGKRLDWHPWNTDKEDSLKKGFVIGVVKDFNFSSLHEKVNTAVLQIFPSAYWKVAVKVQTANLKSTISQVEKVWNKYSPEYPISYKFLDQSFDEMYRAEEKLSALLWIFTGLAIFIGCLGLLGLATFAAEQRIKEIGIRKVLGASATNITGMLSGDFMKLVLLAAIISLPIAWITLSKWLEEFPYRISMNAWLFILSAAVALVVALFTVSFQAIRAASSNPVKALRTE
ncbi:MAG: macrolide ABC transporter permease [Bacteroidetes bacterium]|nr:MAG: macrolide ABC transporter permease [Bacteroidota bacterium]